MAGSYDKIGNKIPTTGGGVGGTSDHGSLTGLADDDHPQYHTAARALAWLQTQSIGELGDVDITTVPPTFEQVLAWDGTNFVPVEGISSFVPATTGAILGYITGIGWVAYNVGNGLTSSSGTLALGGTLTGAVVFDMSNNSFSFQAGSSFNVEANNLIFQANTNLFLQLAAGTNGQVLQLADSGTGRAVWADIPGGSPTASTVPIEFDLTAKRIYGTPSVPLTGSLTFDTTGAVLGGQAVVYYQDSADPFDPFPTVAGHTIKKFGGQAFVANVLMVYNIVYQDPTTILVYPERIDTSPPVVTGLVFPGGATIEDGVPVTATYTYTQAENVVEDTSALILEIWEGPTAVSLDIAEIEAGNPTLKATQTGDPQYVPDQDGVYLRARVRAYSTDPTAPGSEWAYTPVYGPVATASGFVPTDVPAVKIWYDFSLADGGAVGTSATQWEFVYNKVDGTNQTDLRQTSVANQAAITNQNTDFAAQFDSNDRYTTQSWTLVGDLIPSLANRTFYTIVKFEEVGGTYQRFMYLGGGQFYVDTTLNSLRLISGPATTANDFIDSSGYVLIKLQYDSVANEQVLSVLAGAGVNGGTPLTIAGTGGGTAAWSSAVQNQPEGENKWRHIVVCDDTITAQQRIDLEAWLVTQAGL